MLSIDQPPRNLKFDQNYHYVFLAEWRDLGNIPHEICIQFYPYDNSLQIFDMKLNKMFVKRSFYPIEVENLRLGCSIKVFGKICRIVNCSADTRLKLFEGVESNFAMVKPASMLQWSRILATIERMGFKIRQMKKANIDKEFAEQLYDNIDDITVKPMLISFLTKAEVIGLEIERFDCINAFSQAIGNMNPQQAAPGTVRRLFGEDTLANAVHGCKSLEKGRNTLFDFFKRPSSSSYQIKPCMKNTTCGIIKPHAVNEGLVGRIMEHIVSNGFEIKCLAMFTIDIVDSEEFLELYHGVLPENEELVWEMASGPCVVMELMSEVDREDSVHKFRKMCGPRDPELARMLYPDSIRAKYGYNNVQNAIYCTDLEEEAALEISYFFELLTQRHYNQI